MGRVAGAFGIHGWLKLKVFTERPEGLASHPRWWLQRPEGWRSAALEDLRVRPAGVSAKLAGVDDRTAADALRGSDVAVTREDLGEAGEGEYYWVDLVGLAVVDVRGKRLGDVSELLRAGAADVLVVKGEAEHLIPFVDDYVKSVDRVARCITVDWETEDGA
jgi:16S rRNA processing protein RimM